MPRCQLFEKHFDKPSDYFDWLSQSQWLTQDQYTWLAGRCSDLEWRLVYHNDSGIYHGSLYGSLCSLDLMEYALLFDRLG